MKTIYICAIKYKPKILLMGPESPGPRYCNFRKMLKVTEKYKNPMAK